MRNASNQMFQNMASRIRSQEFERLIHLQKSKSGTSESLPQQQYQHKEPMNPHQSLFLSIKGLTKLPKKVEQLRVPRYMRHYRRKSQGFKAEQKDKGSKTDSLKQQMQHKINEFSVKRQYQRVIKNANNPELRSSLYEQLHPVNRISIESFRSCIKNHRTPQPNKQINIVRGSQLINENHEVYVPDYEPQIIPQKKENITIKKEYNTFNKLMKFKAKSFRPKPLPHDNLHQEWSKTTDIGKIAGWD